MNDDTRTRLWPIGLRRFAAIIGADATLQLAEVFGGTEKNNIPKNPYLEHPFVNVIGYDNFAALCRELGPDKIDIPRGAFMKSKKDRILAATGTNREVALENNCSQRYVRAIRASVGYTHPEQPASKKAAGNDSK